MRAIAMVLTALLLAACGGSVGPDEPADPKPVACSADSGECPKVDG